MILGHEPTHPFCCVFVVAVALWPAFCWGEPARKEPSNSWTTGPNPSPSDAPAKPQDSTGDGTVAAKELPDPWEAPSQKNVEPARSASGESNEPGDDDWLDEAELALNHEPEQAAESTDVTDVGPEPRRRRRVPNYSLWLGPGLGWSMPFGDLWGTCKSFDGYGNCTDISNVPSRRFFGSGLGIELDAGMRLARNYNLYGLWERTWFGAGHVANGSMGHQNQGESDFIALGLRVSTEPDKLGFALDIAVGTRRMRARWQDGTQLQLTQAPFETRIGIGADIRLDDNWSFAPLLSLGLGSFGKAEWVHPDGTIESASQPSSVALTHGWVGIQLAAHADVFGTK